MERSASGPFSSSPAEPLQELAVPVKMSVADHVNNHEPQSLLETSRALGDKSIVIFGPDLIQRAEQLDRSDEGQVFLVTENLHFHDVRDNGSGN